MLAHKRNRRIVASASFGVFQRLVQVASTLLIMPLTLRALGPARFGVWGAVASLAWTSGLLDLGTGSALVTLVARSLARNRVDEARTHLTGALTIGSCLACLLLVLTFTASLLAGSRGNSAPYLIAFTVLP